MQQVAKHLPLGGRQVASLDRLILGVVDRFLDLVAKRGLMVFAEQESSHPAPQPAAAFFLVAGRHQLSPS